MGVGGTWCWNTVDSEVWTKVIPVSAELGLWTPDVIGDSDAGASKSTHVPLCFYMVDG